MIALTKDQLGFVNSLTKAILTTRFRELLREPAWDFFGGSWKLQRSKKEFYSTVLETIQDALRSVYWSSDE